jgi:hypothetical protein
VQHFLSPLLTAVAIIDAGHRTNDSGVGDLPFNHRNKVRAVGRVASRQQKSLVEQRIHYSAKHQRLLINWTLGTLIIGGPKVLEFYEDFCNHRTTSLKSDDKDILTVTLVLKRGTPRKLSLGFRKKFIYRWVASRTRDM